MSNETVTVQTKSKVPAVQTIAELLRAAYGGKRKRLTVPKNALVAMRSAPKPTDLEWGDALNLARADRTLERTREVMFFIGERMTAHPGAVLLREFVGQVLRAHPAFLPLDGVLRNLPDAMSVEVAIKHVWSQSFSSLAWREGLAPVAKKQAEEGRFNALCCLLLWLRETRGLAVERIQAHLASLVWETASRRNKGDAQKLRALMSSKDRSALGTIVGNLERRISDYRNQSMAAHDAAEQANARAEKLSEDLFNVSDALKKESELRCSVQEDLEADRQRHAAEMAHARSELEDLRGRVLRRMREEITLLDEGLRALRKEQPRVHVMEDHAERAIDGLKRGIEEITGEQNQ